MPDRNYTGVSHLRFEGQAQAAKNFVKVFFFIVLLIYIGSAAKEYSVECCRFGTNS